MFGILEQYWPLILAIVISSILLVIFIYLKSIKPNLLEIDTKWLAISMMPVLMVLLTGGYIYKFKGFGIEIETSLKKPIQNEIELKAEEVMMGEISDAKSTLTALARMPQAKKRSIDRLSFKNKYQKYESYAVKEYLKQLPNLEYIELLGGDSKFIGLMLAENLKGKEDEFIQSLKNGSVLFQFKNFVVTESLDYDVSAIEALTLIREGAKRFLPLLDKQGYMKGVVTEAALEKRIADEVLQASK